MIYPLFKQPLFLFITGLLLCSMSECSQESLYFESPQPDGLRNRKAFKKAFQGIYASRSEFDSTLIMIGPQQIVMAQKHYLTESRFELELDTVPPDFDITNDQILLSWLQREAAKIEDVSLSIALDGDSVILTSDFYFDTLFSIGPTQVLRYDQGNYFLNKRESDGQWTSSWLSLSKDRFTLSISRICVPESETGRNTLHRLAPLYSIEADSNVTNRYLIRPDKRVLRNILQQHEVLRPEQYHRIR